MSDPIENALPLLNPDFSEWTSVVGGYEIPTGWEAAGALPAQGAHLTQEQYARHDAQGSLKISSNLVGIPTWFGQKVEGLTPGQEYAFSGWVQVYELGDDDPLITCAYAVSLDGQEVSNTDGLSWSNILISEKQVWVRFEYSFTATGEEVTVYFRHSSNLAGNNVSYWSDYNTAIPDEE